MTYPAFHKETSAPGEHPECCHQRRIFRSAGLFRIVLRLAGVLLLLSQIVQGYLAIAEGDSVSLMLVVGGLLAIVLLLATRPPLLENALTAFAIRSRYRRSRYRRYGWYLYTFPFVFSAFVLWVKIQMGPVSDRWIAVSGEGGLSEYGTALLYLLMPVFAYPMAKAFKRRNQRLMAWLYYLIVAAAFFVGMEELSWGQKLIGFEEPEFISRHNVQSEFTLHNLSFYQNHLSDYVFMIVGLIGSFVWIGLHYWQNRQRRLSLTSPALDLRYLFPDWPISSFFYPIAIFYIVREYTDYETRFEFIHGADQEHWEFVMSIGIFLFVLINFFRQGKEIDKELD